LAIFASDWTSDSHLTHYLPSKSLVFLGTPELESNHIHFMSLPMHLLSKISQIIMVYHNYFIDLLQLWPYDASFLFTLPDDELLPTLAQDIVLIIYV
jgi:hypothetical protein